MRRVLPILVLFLTGCAASRSGPMADLRFEDAPEEVLRVVRDAPAYRCQVLVSEVRHDRGARRLERHAFRVDEEYFYPASAIKLAAAVGAAEFLDGLRAGGAEVSLRTLLTIWPMVEGEPLVERDPTDIRTGLVSAGHEVRKLFLVSDNRAFNRLYELLGHEQINQRMHDAGLRTCVINHRLSDPRAIDDQRRTPRVDLHTPSGTLTVPEKTSPLRLTNAGARGLLIGDGVERDGATVLGPMDFTARNGISLLELQDMLVMLVRPEIDVGRRGYRLSDESRVFLLEAMRELPGESANPRYSREEYPDDGVKFLRAGVLGHVPPERLLMYNKVGQAYGFTVENAYLEDTRSGRAVFVTAVLYTNADGVLNDDRYEYDGVALPFMAGLGAMVAERFLLTP